MLDYDTPTPITPLLKEIDDQLDELYEIAGMLRSLENVIRFFMKRKQGI